MTIDDLHDALKEMFFEKQHTDFEPAWLLQFAENIAALDMDT